jgi:hypothetical protein
MYSIILIQLPCMYVCMYVISKRHIVFLKIKIATSNNLAGFDLKAHSSAGIDDTTRPRSQGVEYFSLT